MNDEMRQLEDMRRAAYGLGLDFARAAQAQDDLALKLQLGDAFKGCFQALRLSLALEARLQAAPRMQSERVQRAETERAGRPVSMEPPAHVVRPDSGVAPERERELDRETVSLPKLLRTLNRVADDAQALMPQAAELPALRDLLDQVGAKPASRRTPAASRPSGALRARLSGGTAALTLATPPKPARPDLPGLPRRRATGPPKR